MSQIAYSSDDIRQELERCFRDYHTLTGQTTESGVKLSTVIWIPSSYEAEKLAFIALASLLYDIKPVTRVAVVHELGKFEFIYYPH